MVKVTGLLSTYHDTELLRGRLDNLLTQDVDLEVVVIAQKDSKEIMVAANWWTYDEYIIDIELIETDGIPTLYNAWNMGILLAEGEYLTNINTDDRLYPGALQKMVDVLDNDPSIGVVYPDVDRVDEIDGEPFATYSWAEGGFDRLIKGCFLGPMPMWRKSLHDEYGLFDPTYHSSGDYEFWLRLAKAGVKFQRIPEPLGAYFDRQDNIENREPLRTAWETSRARSLYRGQ